MSLITKLPDVHQKYRPDIDGLRALAVLAVALYHAEFPYITGGFVGVDIFFVISGYLITETIKNEISQGSFTLRNFYARRFARILPSFIVVAISVLAASSFLLFKEEVVELAKDLESSAFFVLNIFLNRQAGDYFHNSFELKPLLHLWSLSVEEQFYIFWPWILVLLFAKKANVSKWVAILITASLVMAILAIYEHHTKDAFFLIQHRAWELLIGSFIAVNAKRFISISKNWLEFISVTGLFLTLIPIFFYSKQTVFPGAAALLPTLGAALLIVGGKDSFVNKHILSARPFVAIGLVSYAFYLWHWPLLAFARIMHIGELPFGWGLSCLILALFLAFASTKYLEQPIRQSIAIKIRQKNHMVPPLVLFALSIVLVFSLGRFVREHQEVLGLDFPHFANTKLDSPSPCYAEVNSGQLQFKNGCVTAKTNEVFVWGDSHANHYGLAVQEHLFHSNKSLGTTVAGVGGCPPFPGIERIDDDRNCASKSKIIYEYIINNDNIKTVALAARFVAYAKSLPFGKTNVSAPIKLADLAGRQYKNQEELVLENVKALANDLIRHGKKVVILGEVPTQNVAASKCYARKELSNYSSIKCSISSAIHLSRFELIESYLQAFALNTPSVCFLTPTPMLCAGSDCLTIDDDKILYSDDNHMNQNGAALLSKIFENKDCF
ncbi:MAG: hypothetical protein RIR18_1246 [Pseudomonadota bacterium]|jgi:peptidoglycan/LPS O-acetylase OafA/YrhL